MLAESVHTSFDLLPDPVFILEPDTLRIVHANQAAEAITGLTTTDLEQLNLLDLHPGDEQPAVFAEIERFREGTAMAVEYRAGLCCPETASCMAAVKLSRATLNDLPYLIAIARDISEQHHTEQQLHQNTILYNSLIAALSDLMFRITREGIYRDFHIPETSHLESPPPDAIIGKHVREIVPEHVTKAVMPVIDEVVKKGTIGTVEYAIQEPHGLRHYEARFVPSVANEIIAVVRDITQRKREADVLRDSEKMARALINASGDSAVLIDRNWVILAINDTAAERLGHSADEMIGTTILDYFPPQTKQNRIQRAQEMLKTKKPTDFVDTRDGRTYYNRASPILDDQGEISRVAVFSRDITKERQDEIERQRRNRLVRGVAEATRRLLDPGRYAQAMEDALAILGRTAEVDRILVFEHHEQVDTGTSLLDLRCLWARDDRLEHLSEVHYQDYPWIENGFEQWHATFKAGDIICGPVQALPAAKRQQRDSDLSVLAVPIFVKRSFWGFITLDDCRVERVWTDAEINVLQTMAASLGSAIARHQIEENLRQETQFINTVRTIGNSLALTRHPTEVLDQLLIQIRSVIPYDTACAMLLNNSTAHIVASQGFERFGHSDDSLMQKGFLVDDVPYMQLMMKTHEPYASPDIHADPIWHPLTDTAWIKSWLGAPIVFNGRVQGFFALDSTQKGFYTNDSVAKIKYFAQQAGIALKTAHDVAEIEDLERVKSEIIRIASHDLRTPLTRIHDVLQELRAVAEDHCTPRQNHALQIAIAANRDMDHIITNILSLERIEARQREAQPIYWHDVINQALDSAQDELHIHKHALTLEIEPDLPITRGHPFKLERAISNLLHNAIKYTPDGGHIQLRAEVRPYGQQKTVAVEVKDDGIGIPLEHQEQLFQPFYRAQQSGTEHVPGTGLGLTMIKSVIEEHNGNVYFDSVPGQGSLFGFWVPV